MQDDPEYYDFYDDLGIDEAEFFAMHKAELRTFECRAAWYALELADFEGRLCEVHRDGKERT
jgi:hypothetical protein